MFNYVFTAYILRFLFSRQLKYSKETTYLENDPFVQSIQIELYRKTEKFIIIMEALDIHEHFPSLKKLCFFSQ